MKIIALDFETFFDSKSYSLSRMSTESYCRDARFEAHGAAIKWELNISARWYAERELRYVLKEHSWKDTFIVCHHSAFDCLILSHHYNVHPKMIGCTLSMARLMLGNHVSVSLDSVRKHFNFPAKITPYRDFDGKHWNKLSPAVQEQIADGAVDEVESIYLIFQKFMQMGFPLEELEIIDQTIKMFSEPVLRADTRMLADVWEQENKAKIERAAALQVDPKELQSTDKFVALLQAEDVEIEYKDGKNGLIPCCAKNDDFMRALLEDENPRVKALAEARIGEKSTALQTRAETLGWMASRGNICIYLKYAGAHTTRWSGGDGSNPQNFKRVDKKNWQPNIRDAILPPEGYILLDPDLSQVECRILSYLAGQEDALEEFRRGEDPYLKLASAAYGFEVTKAMPKERGTGKQLKLSCGFQAGAKTIQRTARLGIYGPPVNIDLDTATKWRDIYREQNPMVVEYWKEAGRMISRLAGGPPTSWGPFTIRDKRLYLPNGTFINYETLEYHRDPETGEEGWRFRKRQGWTRLYSGKLVENAVQFAARCVASQAFLRIVRLGYRIVNTEHDKHWVLIPKDGHEKHHAKSIHAEMVRDVPWMPRLPLGCEYELPNG